MQDYIKLKQQLEILWQEVERMERENPEPGPGGTSDYTELTNKPSINGVELNGNKTLTQLGIASAASLSSLISQFDDLFAVDNVSVVSDGEYPTTLDSRLTLHQPINLNNVNYYFFEESGVDYSYFAIDTSGAYPKISLAQLLKDSHRVVFYEFATDTVPTDNSDNFITSGGVYTALSGKANIADLGTAAAADTTTSITSGGTGLPTSGTVYTALANKENKIETLTASGTITNATDMTDSGVGIDIPANTGIWQINACIVWDGVRPTGGQLRITFGVRTSEYLIANSISTNDEGKNFMYLPLYACVETTPYYPSDADQTIHVKVWGKAASATGTNRVYIVAKQIKA